MYVSTDTLHEKATDIGHTNDIAYLEELTKEPRELCISWTIIKTGLDLGANGALFVMK